MSPLSSAPIFHGSVERTKRPKDMGKHSLRYRKNMLKIREEQGHLSGKKLTTLRRTEEEETLKNSEIRFTNHSAVKQGG